MTLRISGLSRLISQLHINPTGPFIAHVLSRRQVHTLRWSSSSTAHAFQPIDQVDELLSDDTNEQDILGSISPEPSIRLETPSNKVVLRGYQDEAIQACIDALSSGLTRIGVSSPTGSGKTTMFMHLIPKVPSSHASQDGRGRTLILVSSVELANQAEMAAKRLLGDEWSVEVEQAKRHASGRADVTIATYQTLNNVDRLRKFDPRLFKLIIVDEAHHAAALSYLRMLHYFNQDVELPKIMSPIESENDGSKVPIVGFSATFSRPDQLALSAVFEKIVYHREIVSMLDEGWLSPVKCTAVKADLQLNKVEVNNQGDYNTASLSNHLNTPLVNGLVVRSYLHRASDRRSTLIFCVDLKHVADLTQAFRGAGIDARSISSLSQSQARKDTIQGFSAGDFPVLINCEVLTEGTDIPEIDCIILARPTRSKNLLVQMVGRGLRPSPSSGKKNCFLIDIVDNVSRSNGMLVSPTLWGLSHDDIPPVQRPELPSTTPEEGVEPTGTEGENGVASVFKVTYVDQNDPFRLHKRGQMPISTMSHNAWVACGKGRYILELFDLGYILVSSTEPKASQEWSISHRQRLPAQLGPAFYARSRQVALADTLERALQTADKFAERRIGRDIYKQLSRYAAWRQRAPSKKALEMLYKMKGVNFTDGKELDIMGKRIPRGKITAGQVSAYLCAANHGAVSARKKLDRSSAARDERQAARLDKAAQLAARNLPLPSP